MRKVVGTQPANLVNLEVLSNCFNVLLVHVLGTTRMHGEGAIGILAFAALTREVDADASLREDVGLCTLRVE
jgi:hypothetical protein